MIGRTSISGAWPAEGDIMRERVGHGEVDRESVDGGDVRRRRAPGPSGGEAGPAGRWRVDRRRPRGPRPVRPGRPVVAVRPPEPARPEEPVALSLADPWRPTGPRVLARRPALRCGPRYRARRVLGGLALFVASATAVVALGLLARVAAPAGAEVGVPAGPAAEVQAGPAVVTAEPGETVWEVASRVAPQRSGAARAALAERIVADNALTSVRLRPGQVLRVAAG